MPKVALDKEIADKMCTARAVQVGSRWTDGRARALRGDFTVDWNKGGPYRITVAGTDRKIEHCSGASVDFPKALNPEHITMTEPFSDQRCQIEMQGIPPLRVRDLFEKDAGPRALVLLNLKNASIDKIATDEAAATQADRDKVFKRARNEDVQAELEANMVKNSKDRRASRAPPTGPKRPRKTSLVIQMAAAPTRASAAAQA